ncbi:MAG: hypothetical protein RJA07_1173 [Bacteroidota bacterium]|jgi:hypothetical protein
MKYAIKKLLCNSLFLKRSLFIGFFFLTGINTQAQVNYIPNPSFEKLTTCIFFAGDIHKAQPWDTLKNGGGGLPSLFNACNSLKGLQVPNTEQGYRTSKSGKGVAWIDSYVKTSKDIHYYLQSILSFSLTSNKTYTVTFFVSHPSGCPYAIDRIGAYLDNGSISTPSYGGLVNVIPQVENPQHHIIIDTVNWTKIQGCFIANGTESYLTLGNFYPDSLTDTMSVSYVPHGLVDNASFFIDDVSVIESSATIQADNDTTILKGDTITLGKSIEGMPVDWYDIQGNLLAASSTLKVNPTTTTSYVVKMDLCGNVSYDTVKVSVSVGIEQLTFENGQLEVYPNPCMEKLLVMSDKSRTFGIVNTIEVTDVLGRVVIQQIKNSSTQQIQIDVSGLSNGLYFIKATDIKGNVMNAKFVKE